MSDLRFLTEAEPPRGVAFAVAPAIRRLVANNPGPYTYHGTNTYIAQGDAGITVIDPGPDDPAQVEAILEQAGGTVARIFLTHTHRDHVGALPALAARTGAAVFSHPRVGHGHALADGARVGQWTALHTPGHAADHVCFAREDGTVLTGDHVMGFSTSVVIPPDGDMAAYMASLRRMLERDDAVFLPGHGPPIEDPRPFTAALLRHREQREAAVLAELRQGPATAALIVARLYQGLDVRLTAAAEASVTAHLLKLAEEGAVLDEGGTWRVR